eukprot:SAG31_NODE_34498_length_332_cov_0.888412_1_plen_39_part_01
MNDKPGHPVYLRHTRHTGRARANVRNWTICGDFLKTAPR